MVEIKTHQAQEVQSVYVKGCKTTDFTRMAAVLLHISKLETNSFGRQRDEREKMLSHHPQKIKQKLFWSNQGRRSDPWLDIWCREWIVPLIHLPQMICTSCCQEQIQEVHH